MAARAALVNLRWENVLRNGKRFAEEIDLVALGLKKVVPWVLKEKVHLHATRADVVERVPATIADVVLIGRCPYRWARRQAEKTDERLTLRPCNRARWRVRASGVFVRRSWSAFPGSPR